MDQQKQYATEWYKELLPAHQKKLEVLHFNDVYNLEERETGALKAGAARFVAALDQYNSSQKLVIFSGDLFFPSNLSTYFEGEQMILPFNRMNVDVSCLGNHELDISIERAMELIAQTNCPWIMSNLVESDKEMRPVADVLPYKVLENQGFKIGFLGFAEEAWLDQLSPEIDCDKLNYLDYNETLQKYSKQLKEEHNCDMIIALNHMRNFEDQDMASQNNSDVVDLIFGGHDHAYIAKLNRQTDVNVLKSGTDFECFTNFTVLFDVEKADFDDFVNSTKFYENLHVDYSEKLKRMYISEKVYITDMFAPDSEILEHVSKYTQQLALIEEQPAGHSTAELEARFSRLRTEETNLGNLIADIIRSENQADFGISNAGSLRANCVFEKGQMQIKFIGQILPIIDTVQFLRVTGKSLKEILENGVSLWPKYDGRWPVTSGFKFKFDPSQPAGDRIVPGSLVTTNNEAIDMDRYYTLSAKNFMVQGKDGYRAFLDPSVQTLQENRENLPSLQDLVKTWFKSFQKTDAEIEKLPPKALKILQDRIKCLHASQSDRDEDTGFIKFSSKVEGRIVNIGDKLEHND